MKKRYWANVSDASIQSEDTERSVLRRTKREFRLSLVRRPRLDNLLDSSIENNVYAGAVRGCCTVKFERNVAFLMVIIVFTLSDATRL